jgi:hypothetical protein
MNVRFSASAMRCRATSAELEQLLTGRAISLDLNLPRDRRFRVNVRPSALETWQLESDPTGIWVSIPRTQIEAFGKTLPSKEGFEHGFETAQGRVTVSFEVDLRDSGESG